MKTIVTALLLALIPSFALAQSARDFPTANPGERVPMIVEGCLNAQGLAVPTSSGTCAFYAGSSGGGSGGGTGSGTVSQGSPNSGQPWPMVVYVAGAAASTANPLPVAGPVVATQGPAGAAPWLAQLTPGSALIGKVGIDQTTPGTTNGVVVTSSSLPAGAATAAGQAAQQGAVTPGTPATSSVLGGQIYNAAAPTPASGQQLALQADAAGNLKVNNATIPPGAATSALQSTGNSSLSSIAANQNATAPGTSAPAAQAVQGVTGGVPLPVQGGNTTPVKTDGSAITQPVSNGGAFPVQNTAPTPAGTNQIGALLDATQPAGYPAAISAAGATPTIDTAGYGSVSLSFTGTFSGTGTFQESPDGVNWTNAAANSDINGGGFSDTFSSTAPGSFTVAAKARYVRVNVTPLASGTVTISAILRSSVPGVRSVYVGGAAPQAQAASAAAGGVAGYSRIPSSAATTNPTVAKASAGRVYKIFACNTTTSAAFVKLYNTGSAPTVGTTTVVFSRPIPPAAAAGGLNCASYDMADLGWYFSAGISYAVTGGNLDSDTTALTAGQVTQLSVEYQ